MIEWNGFELDSNRQLDRYNAGYITEKTLGKSLISISNHFIRIVENIDHNRYHSVENIYIMKNIIKFIDEKLEKFFNKMFFGDILDKVSLYLVKAFFKYISMLPTYLDAETIPLLKSTLMLMSLSSAKLNKYSFSCLFPRSRYMKRFLKSVKSNADETIRLFFIVLFSTTKEKIINNHTKIILKILSSNKIRFYKLIDRDHCSFTRALATLILKLRSYKIALFLIRNNYELLIDLVLLIQSLFRHLYKTINQPHISFDYVCSLSMYTLKLFRRVTPFVTAGIPGRLYEFLADAFLEAVNFFNDINNTWKAKGYMKYALDCYKDEVSAFSWFWKMKLYIVKAFYCNNEIFQAYIRQDEYKSKYQSVLVMVKKPELN